MKTLYLVRHATSSWDDPSLDDMQRPLNHRGQKNAPDMAQRLNLRGISVDRIISSPALRALTTARTLAQGIGFPEETIVVEQAMYFSGKTAMLDLIRQQDEGINSLMLAGHNPDITSLLNFLCGFQTHNVATCAVATIEFANPWSEITANHGVLRDFDFPKKL